MKHDSNIHLDGCDLEATRVLVRQFPSFASIQLAYELDDHDATSGRYDSIEQNLFFRNLGQATHFLESLKSKVDEALDVLTV